MNIERRLRLIAGLFVASTVALATFVDHRWLWFTAFVGLNLVQSAFTDRCPMKTLLERLGAQSNAAAMETVGSTGNLPPRQTS